MAKPINCPNCSPIIVTTGIKALRRACLNKTLLPFKPFAQAVLTYSAPNTSSIDPRVILNNNAIWNIPKVKAGMIICLQPSIVKSPLLQKLKIVIVSPRPEEGIIPKTIENKYINKIPTKNVGKETPNREPVIKILLIIFLGFADTKTPKEIPNITAKDSATKASSILAGKRSKISSITGTLVTYDIPKLPCKAFFKKLKYCT